MSSPDQPDTMEDHMDMLAFDKVMDRLARQNYERFGYTEAQLEILFALRTLLRDQLPAAGLQYHGSGFGVQGADAQFSWQGHDIEISFTATLPGADDEGGDCIP